MELLHSTVLDRIWMVLEILDAGLEYSLLDGINFLEIILKSLSLRIENV